MICEALQSLCMAKMSRNNKSLEVCFDYHVVNLARQNRLHSDRTHLYTFCLNEWVPWDFYVIIFR